MYIERARRIDPYRAGPRCLTNKLSRHTDTHPRLGLDSAHELVNYTNSELPKLDSHTYQTFTRFTHACHRAARRTFRYGIVSSLKDGFKDWRERLEGIRLSCATFNELIFQTHTEY